jgi:hypothetical protein
MAYLFRGTTDNYEGSTGSQRAPATCASTNFFIAYLFAKECQTKGTAVILIFNEEDVTLDDNANWFEKEEAEKVIQMRPIDAFDNCVKKIYLSDIQDIMKNYNIDEYVEKTTIYKVKDVEVPDQLIEKLLNLQ